MSTNIIIDAVNITKQYGDFKALDDLSLQVERGGVWALLGPNGAGKTTFLKCLLGLKEFSGEIKIDGYDIHKDPKQMQSVSDPSIIQKLKNELFKLMKENDASREVIKKIEHSLFS